MTETSPENKFMKKYITFIIAAVFVLGANQARADHHSKTNKVAQAQSKTTPNKASAEARKKYAAAVKKIREAVKAGKLNEAEAKKKYAALRSKMVPNRQVLLKRFDKNKDCKLCDNEKAAMKKAMEARNKKRGEGKKRSKGKKRRPRK